MLRRANIVVNITRNYSSIPKAWSVDAVKYGNVTYYPRTKDHVDPPFEPSKLLLVHRVKPYKGNPYWEKDMLDELGFEDRKRKLVIVKNTPEMCAMLWKIKHLIKVVPIKLPEKLPDPNDVYEGSYLHDNGTFLAGRRIDRARYEAALRERDSIKTLTVDKVQDQLRKLWLKGSLIP